MTKLNNIPQKLKRKFALYGITTVEDLQEKYYALISSKGFGGIFIAELQKYIKDENIHIPPLLTNPVSLETVNSFSFDSLPPPLIRNALTNCSICTKEDLKEKYRNIISLTGFGKNKIVSLIKFMRELGLIKESNDIETNYLPYLGFLKQDTLSQERFSATLNIIYEKINNIIKSGNIEFSYPIHGALTVLFKKNNIRNFIDLKDNYPQIKNFIYHKRKALNRFNIWLDDTISVNQFNTDSTSHDFFPRFQDALSIFFSSLNTKNKYICEQYFGGIEKNYIGISEQLGITRERVRQICNKYKKILVIYMQGATVVTGCKIEHDLARQLYLLKKTIEKNFFLTLIDIIKFLDATDTSIRPEKLEVIKLLCKIWDFEYFSINPGNTVLITSSPTKKNETIDLSLNIFHFFQKKIYPLSLTELHSSIQNDIGRSIDFAHFEKIVNNLDFFDKKEGLYCLKLCHYLKFEDMAELILHEEGKPLKFQDILDKVNSILLSQKAQTYTGRAGLSFSKNIVHLGKTGYWTLKKYATDSDLKTLKEKIIDVFKAIERPLSINDLKLSIKGPYAETSVAAILNMEKGSEFLSLSHGRYILAKWKDLYKDELKLTRKREKKDVLTKENFSQKITASFIVYFENKQSYEEPLIDIVNFVNDLDGFEKTSIYKAISNNPLFTKLDTGRNKLLHYNKSSEDIMNELLDKKRIFELLSTLLQKSDPNCIIEGNNPYRIYFCNKHFNVYVKNITSTDVRAKERGNYRVQLPYRTEFEEMKSSPTPFIFLGFNTEYNTFASWNSSVIKSKLNTKSNVSLYPRINQMEMARKEMTFKTVQVSGEGDVMSFPCEFLSKFIQEELFISPDSCNLIVNEENYEAEYEQNGLLKKITNPHLIQLLQPVLHESNINRYKAFEIIWNFYGTRYPQMKLSHWGKLLDRLSNDNKKSSV